ncbi:unnamed protein product, partial [Choristocarpus tenellus]
MLTTGNGSACRFDGPNSLIQQTLYWFTSMQPRERAEILTFDDPAWCTLVVNMAARLERRSSRNEHLRFVVEPPAPGSCRASFHSSVTDLSYAGSKAEQEACVAIEYACLGYGDPARAVTLREEFVEEPNKLFASMLTVSRGRFLEDVTTPPEAAGTVNVEGKRQASLGLDKSGVCDRMNYWSRCPWEGRSEGGSNEGEDWEEMSWLRTMGEYSLAAFVANRVEARLRARVYIYTEGVVGTSTATGGSGEERGKGIKGKG